MAELPTLLLLILVIHPIMLDINTPGKGKIFHLQFFHLKHAYMKAAV